MTFAGPNRGTPLLPRCHQCVLEQTVGSKQDYATGDHLKYLGKVLGDKLFLCEYELSLEKHMPRSYNSNDLRAFNSFSSSVLQV